MKHRLAAAAVAACLGAAPLVAMSTASAVSPVPATVAAPEIDAAVTELDSVDTARQVVPQILERSSDSLARARATAAASAPRADGAAPDATSARSARAATTLSTALATTGRIFGSDRYTTAVEISKTTHPDPANDFGGVVIIANGLNFPDALAAGPAATSLNGPILLVPPTGNLPTAVRLEIERLRGPKGPEQRLQSAVILGQSDNVSVAAENELRSLIDQPGQTLSGVFRAAGTNRYETSAILSLFVTKLEETPTGEVEALPLDTAIITNGMTFADAIAGGAAGGWEYAPLLLTAAGGLDRAVIDALQPAPPNPGDGFPGQAFTTVRILGSTATVSTTVQNQIRAILPNASIVRYNGADRFDTAARLNADVFDGPAYEVTLTNGLRFPDALAGAPRVNITGGPTVPVRTTCIPSYSGATIAALTPGFITALGNVDAVSAAALGGAACG